MAPPGSFLRPNEQEWSEVFKRLSERFPTVPGSRVAQALREHNGHAGEAAAVLRDLTGSHVKEADPDDVEHVATLLSSPAMFKHACKEQFKKHDVNKDGSLEWEEVKNLVQNLYEEFGLQLPAEGALKAFFFATDENQDGVLSEREFRKFFEMFLRYAFFDHLKLRQMVEKGQAIEQQRASLKAGDVPLRIAEVRVDDAETTSPQDSRASSASDGSKPDKVKTAMPDEAMPKSQSKLAPIEQPKPAGRRSPPSGQERHERSERSHQREQRNKERERVPPPEASDQGGIAMRCLAPHGVAYRGSADFQDRTDSACRSGQTVQVLEHWIRTPEGWLPVMDQQGQNLFERCGGDSEDAGGSVQKRPDPEQRKRVSIQETQRSDSTSTGRKEDARESNVKSSSAYAAQSAPIPAKSLEVESSGLKASEEEWRPVFERLSERFPNLAEAQIVQALRDNEGHAGKAAGVLRSL